jgi:hypothetical protein
MWHPSLPRRCRDNVDQTEGVESMDTEETTPPLNEAELAALDDLLSESDCPCGRDCGAKVPTKRRAK